MGYCQGFAGMDKNIGIAASAVSLAGAVGCFFYIKKCIKEEENKKKSQGIVRKIEN